MLSRVQEIERLNKIANIMLVMEHTNNINEISKLTGISTSSIQRYLNDDELLKEAGLENEDIANIKQWLKNAKRDGLSRGGKISQKKYGDSYSRLNDGKFSGIKKGK